jgi:hypothetical protein
VRCGDSQVLRHVSRAISRVPFALIALRRLGPRRHRRNRKADLGGLPDRSPVSGRRAVRTMEAISV